MIDPVAINKTNATARVAPAPTPVSATAATRLLSGADEAKVTLPGVAKSLAASPPVDLERISRIKKAIADGTFPLNPTTVADRLLALSLEWNPNDAA
jgi:negative regulator of flagellin synthesis FlgM